MPSSSKARRITFPPLSAAPQWATAPYPDAQLVEDLRATAEQIRKRLGSDSNVISRIPGPTSTELRDLSVLSIQNHLDEMAAILRSMRYPPDLTTWIDEMRGAVDRILGGTQKALDLLQRLSYLRSGTSTYQECLSGLRRCIIKMDKELAALIDGFDDYPSASCAHSDEHNNTNEEWEAGWQAGLHHAADLVQHMLNEHQMTMQRGSFDLHKEISQLPGLLREQRRDQFPHQSSRSTSAEILEFDNSLRRSR